MLAFNKSDLDWNWNCKSLSEAKNRRRGVLIMDPKLEVVVLPEPRLYQLIRQPKPVT